MFFSKTRQELNLFDVLETKLVEIMFEQNIDNRNEYNRTT